MRMFISYLAARWRVLALFAVFTAVFLGLFFLYQLPVSAVVYGFLLCTFIGLIALFFDFSAFREKRLVLQGMLNEVTDTLEHLPQPQNGLEADYQALLRTLFEERRQLRRKLTTRYADTVEYYTMWVHQIKNPIAAMRLLLLQNEEGAQTAELQEELQRIEQYVEMVLYYLRLDSHSSDFLFRSCKLDQILRSAIHTYAGQFIRRKVKLVYHGTDSTVLTDEKWLQFVVEQILSNALKYAPGGTVTIQLEGDVLVIQDTGIGIAEEDLPRIFEKGFTGLNGRGPQRSTGIGLYLCRQITSRLGHIITIESQPGQGTTVRLDLSHKFLEFD